MTRIVLIAAHFLVSLPFAMSTLAVAEGWSSKASEEVVDARSRAECRALRQRFPC